MCGHSEEIRLNPTFRDMLFALSDEKADFLIVGAFSLAVHGIPRATGDIDIFVRPTPENAQKVWRSLVRFGAPLSGWSPDDFAQPKWIFAIGREPNRIDLLTVIDGVDFETAWEHHITTLVDGRPMPVIGLAALLANKRAAARPKDLLDAAWIEVKLKALGE
jgi:hypothetical protein